LCELQMCLAVCADLKPLMVLFHLLIIQKLLGHYITDFLSVAFSTKFSITF